LNLDEAFGTLRQPSFIDEWEHNASPVSLRRLDSSLASELKGFESLANTSLFRGVALTIVCLWVIDSAGELFLAIEELAPFETRKPHIGYPRRRDVSDEFEKRKLGHPTLVGLKQARIAGELILDVDPTTNRLCWFMNVLSGRYCRLEVPSAQQLRNAAGLLSRHGVNVEIDTLMTR
jgi:hypothetical protein